MITLYFFSSMAENVSQELASDQVEQNPLPLEAFVRQVEGTQRDITTIRQELYFVERRLASLEAQVINQSQRNIQRDITAIRQELECLKRSLRVASVELSQLINRRPGGHPAVPVQPLPEL